MEVSGKYGGNDKRKGDRGAGKGDRGTSSGIYFQKKYSWKNSVLSPMDRKWKD